MNSVNLAAVKEFLKTCSKEDVQNVQQSVDDRTFDLGINQYSSGKAYNFIQQDTGAVAYTGSTIQSLECRRSGHQTFWKTCPEALWSLYVKANGGPENFILLCTHKVTRTQACHKVTRTQRIASTDLSYSNT